MFRNGCVIKKHAQLRKIRCPPPLSNLKDMPVVAKGGCQLILSHRAPMFGVTYSESILANLDEVKHNN